MLMSSSGRIVSSGTSLMEIGLESWLNLMTQDKEEEAAAFNSELEADMDLISLIDISKHYEMGDQTVKALDSVTVHIAKNDYLAFIGSSGSGKSTMLNILGCLDRPSTGTYHLNGKDVDSLTENELSEIRNLRLPLGIKLGLFFLEIS